MCILFENFYQAENEIQSLERRNQLLDEDRDQLETRVKSSHDEMHEASKLVDEFERSDVIPRISPVN